MAANTPRIHLPEVDDDFVDDVLDEMLSMRETMPEIHIEVPSRHASTLPPSGVGSEFDLLVALVETALDEEVGEFTARLYAQLALMSALPGVPEAIALQVAFGPKVGVQQAQKIALLRSAARTRTLTVDEYVAELRALGRIPLDTLVRLFHGRSRRVPLARRIKRGSEVLREVASSVPVGLRPPLLCALAWLHWAGGRRAIAAGYLAESTRIDPTNILATGLAMLFAERAPDWCVGRSGVT